MNSQLTNEEKAICARIGVSESEYLAQRGRNTTVGPMTVEVNPALRQGRQAGHRAAMQSLPAPERGIAVVMNMDPREYLARRAGRHAGTVAMRSWTPPIDARTIIAEAGLEHNGWTDDEHTTAGDLVGEAREALDDFDSEDPDAWRSLAMAAAFIEAAIERCAPPYVNREPYGAKEAERRRRAGE